MQTYGFEKQLAGPLAFIILGKIPGIFGFIVWELKENWRLYQANRPADLTPTMIGHHGETLPRLLRPGFHSGTLPKLYARLRRADRRAIKGNDWRAARRQIELLHHNEEALRRFADRELLVYVNGAPAWAGQPMRLVDVEAGSNRVWIELECPAASAARMTVTFEEQSGWLIASAANTDWHMTPDQRTVLELALFGFYKVGGTDLRCSDIESVIGPETPFDLSDAGLVVWPGDESEVVYNLAAQPTIAPRVVGGHPIALPTVPAADLVFRRRPALWAAWVTAWERMTNSDDCDGRAVAR
jgi:hypothetical protein